MSSGARRLRLGGLAIVYGLVAGVVSQLTLQGMTTLQHLVWTGPAPWWRIAVTVCAGGVLLVLLRRFGEPLTMDELLAAEPGNRARRNRLIVTTALTAIVAVAFGGAVGPEAGLLAVVAEVGAVVGHRITRDVEEERILHGAGTAGALSGLYASPPGATAVDGDELGPPKALQLLAGIAGFFSFLFCSRFVFGGEGVSAVVLPEGELTWWLVLPALGGAVLGFAFRWLHHGLELLAARLPNPTLRITVGTVLFAALAAALPLVLFSGHHEIAQLGDPLTAGQAGTLVLIAVAKTVALGLCLVAGWRGGEFFPLVFAGAAAGAAVAVSTGMDAGPAMAAAMGAAVVAGWGKPLAAFFVLILLVSGVPAVAVLGGVGVGWVLVALLPTPDAQATRPDAAAAVTA